MTNALQRAASLSSNRGNRTARRGTEKILLGRLIALIGSAIVIRKRRVKTTPSRSVREKWLDAKTRQGHLKNIREHIAY